jgi:ribonuclease HI
MYTAVFDGGKNKHGTYYSFIVLKGKKVIKFVSRDKIDFDTNNEAEYVALIKLLMSLVDLVSWEDEIVIIGDSQLVINQVNGWWDVTAKNLIPLSVSAKWLFKLFPNAELKWWPDDLSKQILGH